MRPTAVSRRAWSRSVCPPRRCVLKLRRRIALAAALAQAALPQSKTTGEEPAHVRSGTGTLGIVIIEWVQ
jgi:hypothetical protein